MSTPQTGPKPKSTTPLRDRVRAGDIIAAAAVIVTIATFLYANHVAGIQNRDAARQANMALLQQLRNQYPEITNLELAPVSSLEEQVLLSVTTRLLYRLKALATGSDYLFVADAYRRSGYEQIAIPLYQTALKRLSQPVDLITADRGLAYSYAAVDQPNKANDALQQAVQINNKSHYPVAAKTDDALNTQRVWVAVAAIADNCAAVRRHARRYFGVLRHLDYGFAPPGRGDVHYVRTKQAECTSRAPARPHARRDKRRR